MTALTTMSEVFRTALGRGLCVDSREYLAADCPAASVNLIMTSPPYALLTKKAYGNPTPDEYLDWFRPFAEAFARVLTPDGSVAINLDGTWNRGHGTRTIYHYQLLVMLVQEYGYHLIQEYYWWNPSKMPSSYWSTVPRTRANCAVECVWLLSQNPEPKADNRNVLWPYRTPLRTGRTKTYHHPGGHSARPPLDEQHHGGAVPHNLIAASNAQSNGEYQRFCRDRGITMHPARFPPALPQYFIRLCTDVDDHVLDPFGGSCTTGHVAETLGRRWTCCDQDIDYLRGAVGRFMAPAATPPREAKLYTIPAPCQVPENPSARAAPPTNEPQHQMNLLEPES